MNINLAYCVWYETMVIEQVIVIRIPQLWSLRLSLGVCYYV